MQPILEKNVFLRGFAAEKVKKWCIWFWFFNVLYDLETELPTLLSFSLTPLFLPYMTWYTAVKC
jgi:hypothetical protein